MHASEVSFLYVYEVLGAVLGEVRPSALEIAYASGRLLQVGIEKQQHFADWIPNSVPHWIPRA
jgi:hypothetical protein